MGQTLRQTIMIGPQGRVEVPTTELTPGSMAEIIVLPLRKGPPFETVPVNREAVLERMWALRDNAIAEGMELWDIDRVNAEVAERRYGDRETY